MPPLYNGGLERTNIGSLGEEYDVNKGEESKEEEEQQQNGDEEEGEGEESKEEEDEELEDKNQQQEVLYDYRSAFQCFIKT